MNKDKMAKALANAAPIIAAIERSAARSDHFALALPFEEAKGSQFGAIIGFSLAIDGPI